MPACVSCAQASISPGESGLVTVIGTGVLRVFKLAEQTLKPMPLNTNRRDTLSFTCQAWVGAGDAAGGGAAAGDAGKGGTSSGGSSGGDRDRQLLGTADGEILVFEVRRQGQWGRGGSMHAWLALGWGGR
jgi:hypothetical protein